MRRRAAGVHDDALWRDVGDLELLYTPLDEFAADLLRRIEYR